MRTTGELISPFVVVTKGEDGAHPREQGKPGGSEADRTPVVLSVWSAKIGVRAAGDRFGAASPLLKGRVRTFGLGRRGNGYPRHDKLCGQHTRTGLPVTEISGGGYRNLVGPTKADISI